MLPPKQAQRAPRTRLASTPPSLAAGEYWIPVARILDAWGLAGWVKLGTYGDERRSVLRNAKHWRLTAPDQAGKATLEIEVNVTSARPHGAGWTAQFEGFVDRDQALSVKGYEVEIRRRDFPRLARGEYYWVDLIGCEVFNRQADRLGLVVAMDDHGAHPLLQVQLDDRSRLTSCPSGNHQPPSEAVSAGTGSAKPKPAGDFLIPFVENYIDRIDLTERRIDVDWSREWS